MKHKLEITTLFIAIWGAVLSTWIYIDQNQSNQEMFHVSVDATPDGRLPSGELVGNISISITNIGKNTVTIAPGIKFLMPFADGDTHYSMQAFFNQEDFKANKKHASPVTKTLKPGGAGIATTSRTKDKQPFNPQQFHSVMFKTISGGTFSAHFSFDEKFFLKQDGKTNKNVGWSGSVLAEEI